MPKLYSWTNSWLSSIQKGVQTGHLGIELIRTYDSDDARSSEVREWLSGGHTVVIFEGGSSGDLSELNDFFDDIPDVDEYPWHYVNEPSVNGALTAVGLILDDDWDEKNRSSLSNLNEWEAQLLAKLSKSKLAT